MMDAEQKDRERAPFQEECNTDHFFAGGGRGAVLADMIAALNERVDIVTLIGEEGSGKTMLCKMLQTQLGEPYKIIFLPQIVESFEDIVRVVAQECAFDYPAETSRADARDIFLNLVATLRERGESVLLISDEAENIYLATLERIRKMLDNVNQDGGGLQLLFSGRKSFRGNLEQLALCNFADVSEKQFFLSALDEDDTWEYLNFCVQDLQEDSRQEVFTREAAGKIASMGRGNLRMINVFAEESLKSSSTDTSFLVLLDHVSDGGAREELLPASKRVLEQLPFPKKYLAAGGAVCFLFLLIVLFGGGSDEDVALEERVVPVEEVIVVDLPKETLPAETAEAVVEEVVVEEIVVKAEEQGGAEAAKEEPPSPESAAHQPVAISPVEIVEQSEPETTIPELVKQSKIAVGKTKRIVLQPEKIIPVEAATVKPSPGQPLASLVVAGEKWKAGQSDTAFSIQLMSLQSEHAEENLKRIIAEPDYQGVLDKLVMLKRPSNPPVVLVFYGLYPTMAAARNARNNMPIFLRDRHPYPVSVRGAVEKARLQ